jgi:DNA-binding NtrC family response regulator
MTCVLIVDDDSRIRQVLSRWLAAAGYETREAQDAETALAAIATERSGIVLCDVKMPGEGGLWLVERVRERYPEIAVVLATGVDSVPASISLAGNVIDYLMKPFERAAVLTAVSRANAWHEDAVRNAQGAPAEEDPVARWLRGGRPEGSERK